jgi:microcystin degradation protein MlrC
MPRPLKPRIAIGAFMLESNSNAPGATREEFISSFYLTGQAFADDWRLSEPRCPACVRGFVQAMNAIHAGPNAWDAVPLLGAAVGASGSIEQSFFQELVEQFVERLRATLPLDAVYLSLHGAAIATLDPDPDGTLLTRVREVVGPKIPIVATLDLHANVVQRMVSNADVLISYLTNPHVDMQARGAEAAAIVLEILNGTKTTNALVKLPLAPPSVTLNTGTAAEQLPYGDLIRYGQSLITSQVLNISVNCGFTLGDTPKNGMSIIVTTRNDQPLANTLANQIAQQAWNQRHRYVPKLTSLEEATRLAKACGEEPSSKQLLFADVADNAGGGGRANTVWIMQSFIKANVQGAWLGLFFDPSLARKAQQLGVGKTFTAQFNENENHPLSGRYTAQATIEALHDGHVVGKRGIVTGTQLNLGPCALLRVAGLKIVVVSRRVQCSDPVFFEMFGLELANARSIIVKSRGHFRAAFNEFFLNEQIYDVDVPGLTTPVLGNVQWKHMPRPMFPLDPDTEWSPQSVG